MSNNSFWDFSLAHYTKTSVQQLCLQLQEQMAADVNVVLFTLWLASQQRDFEYAVLADNTEVSDWHEQVILPLRQTRCAVKKFRQDDSLYELLKKSELDAERVEQDMLCGLLPLFTDVGGNVSIRVLAERNVQIYLQALPLKAVSLKHDAQRLVNTVFDDEWQATKDTAIASDSSAH